jgi:hypothetical protein
MANNIRARLARLEADTSSRAAPDFMPMADFMHWVYERLDLPFEPTREQLRQWQLQDRQDSTCRASPDASECSNER